MGAYFIYRNNRIGFLNIDMVKEWEKKNTTAATKVTTFHCFTRNLNSDLQEAFRFGS